MAIKFSVWQKIDPYLLQDWQDVNPSAVSYPLNVADWVKGWSSAIDPLSLDIEGLPTGTLATTTELAINNGTVNEKTTLSDLATFLDNRDVYSVADITALNAITGMDTGDVAIVADTFDDTWENVAGSYIYNGTSWLLQSWYNVYLNTLLDVNAPSPVAWDILQWDGTTWVNIANAFAPLNWTPTQVRYFDNAGVDYSDPLFTRDEVTNHTKAVRDYNSQSTINTATVPVQFLTQNTNGTFNIGDQVETQFWEAQAEVLDVNTFVINEISYTNLVYTGVWLNDLTSIYAWWYTWWIFPVTYTMEILQNNVAYSGIGGVNGTLSIGDTITGLTSWATAVIVAIDTYKNILAVDTIIGTFIPLEIVQGNTPSDFTEIWSDFSALADIALYSNSNGNSIITTIAPSSQLEWVEMSFSNFTGHTIGDTRTFQVNPTSTYFVVYLTNVTGTLPTTETRLNNLTTPFQTDDWEILDASFIVGDTIDVIDLSAWFTQVWQIGITQASGQDFTYTLNSGTIAIGNYLYWPSIDKVGFVYNLTSNIVNKTINTGFRTEPIQFPNVPFIIEWSAIVATDGVDKMAVGAFDLSVSGWSRFEAGIVAFYGDSSQSTFTTQKGFANLNLFDSTTNKSLNVNYSWDEFTIQGYNNITDFGLSIDWNRLSYKANGTQFTFPTSIWGIGYVVADVNGNGTLTLEPISSLIGPITNIYNSDWTLTDNRKLLAGSFDLSFSWDNYFNEEWSIGTVDNYENTGKKVTWFKHGYLSWIRSQSLWYEDSQFVYKFYNWIWDFSWAIPNGSFTEYMYDWNIWLWHIQSRLVDTSSADRVHDEKISIMWGSIVYINDNTVVTNSAQIKEAFDVLDWEYVREIRDINDVNIYSHTRTLFWYSAYVETRDDTWATTPINFIYTDNSGKFLSAPLADPYEIIIDMKTANYTVVAADQWHIIHIDNSWWSIDITLPDPSTVRVGKAFKFKAVWNSANIVRFLPFASENIDLVAWAYTWSNPLWLQALEVYTDWINWFIS